MILRCLVALVLGVGVPVYAQSAPPAVPVTEVMAVATSKPGPLPDEARKQIPDEVRGVVRLYLDGKIDQMYMRGDRGAVILFLRAKTVDEAKAILENLPLVKGGYVNVEYVPVGPLMSLGYLMAMQQTPSGSGPH
jgi:hypothetical protein